MKAVFIAIALVFSSVSFASEAEDSAVVKLIRALDEKKAEITELKDQNMGLIFDKLSLTEANAVLKTKVSKLSKYSKSLEKAVQSKNAELAKLYKTTKADVSESADSIKRESITAIRGSLKDIDAALGKML